MAERAERARIAVLAFRKWIEKQNTWQDQQRSQLNEKIKPEMTPPRLVT